MLERLFSRTSVPCSPVFLFLSCFALFRSLFSLHAVLHGHATPSVIIIITVFFSPSLFQLFLLLLLFSKGRLCPFACRVIHLPPLSASYPQAHRRRVSILVFTNQIASQCSLFFFPPFYTLFHLYTRATHPLTHTHTHTQTHPRLWLVGLYD